MDMPKEGILILRFIDGKKEDVRFYSRIFISYRKAKKFVKKQEKKHPNDTVQMEDVNIE